MKKRNLKRFRARRDAASKKKRAKSDRNKAFSISAPAYKRGTLRVYNIYNEKTKKYISHNQGCSALFNYKEVELKKGRKLAELQIEDARHFIYLNGKEGAFKLIKVAKLVKIK